MKGFVEPEIVVDVAAEETTALTADMKDTVDPLGSGFTWYTPPMARPGSSHETNNGRDWSIAGHDMQVLVMSLPVNETVVTYVALVRVLDHPKFQRPCQQNRYMFSHASHTFAVKWVASCLVRQIFKWTWSLLVVKEVKAVGACAEANLASSS
jgi:hypothetical protein